MKNDKRILIPFEKILLVVFFLFSYFILFALTFVGNALSGIPLLNLIFPLSAWNSPMYWLLPIVGFFVIYFLIDYVKRDFKSSFLESRIFPIFYFFFSALAFYINLVFFYTSMVAGKKIIVCIWDCQNLLNQINASGKGAEFFLTEFWPAFRTSAFFVFVLAGILAWFSYHAIIHLKAKHS